MKFRDGFAVQHLFWRFGIETRNRFVPVCLYGRYVHIAFGICFYVEDDEE